MVLMAAVPVPGLAVRVKAPLLVSLVNLPVNSMLEEAVAGLLKTGHLVQLAALAAAVKEEDTCQVVPMVKQTPEAVAEGEADTATIVMPVLAALASCASGCTRKARERGKDNYAVIQERNEDGGIHSAVQQGAPQHRRHHNGAHTAPPGGGLGLAVGAGVLGLPVRAAVAHIPAEDGAEET